MIEYGYIGLTVRQPDPEEREDLGISHGVIIQRVEPDGPAAEAGLQVGDVIVRIRAAARYWPRADGGIGRSIGRRGTQSASESCATDDPSSRSS